MRVEINWEEFRRVRAMHGRFPVRWNAAGRMLVTDEPDKVIVGQMQDDDLAALVAGAHNMFLPVTNALVMCSHRLLDFVRVRHEKVIEEEFRSIWKGNKNEPK